MAILSASVSEDLRIRFSDCSVATRIAYQNCPPSFSGQSSSELSGETMGLKRRRDKTATSGTAESPWENTPDFVEPRRDEVHVWRASLKIAPTRVQSLSQLLSDDERERAGRFRFQRDRGKFITSRALLRILIGRYLHKRPSEIKFSYGRNGKPFLANKDDLAVRFNLSHSKELVLYAVTQGREIGIDIEHISEQVETDPIAGRFFSSSEVAALRALPRGLQRRAFFTCWTRKEAYIKARGGGLSMPLDKFTVSLSPGESALLLDVQWDPEEVSRWSLAEINPDPRYIAALAVEGHDWLLRRWKLSSYAPALDASTDELPSFNRSADDHSD
jgi:4'-phosphopantetheinyl transferase